MQIIKKKIHRDVIFDDYIHKGNICFIDIETMGFSREFNPIYLIGILYYKSTGWELVQIFADSLDEEEEILKNFVSVIRGFSKIFTYNGDSFDIPFINHRLEKYKIDYKIQKDASIDLYRIVKENKAFLNIENLKLKTLERYLGIYRDDIYNGKDCIDFYLEYTRTHNLELLDRILQHNYDDLYYMLDIIKIRDIINEKKTLRIPFKEFEMSLLLHDFNIKGDLFKLSGSITGNKKIKLIYFDNSYKISFMDDNSFELVLEIHKGLVEPNTLAFFIDKNLLNLPKDLIDSTNYIVPNNIILIKVEKNYCVENIMKILKAIAVNSLEEP